PGARPDDGVGLGDRGDRYLTLEGGVDMNLHLSFDGVRAQSPGDGASLLIRRHGQSLRAIGEYAASPTAGKGEGHHGTRNRLVILVLDLDDRFPGSALADVVDGSVALDHQQVGHERNLRQRNLRLSVRQKQQRQYYR